MHFVTNLQPTVKIFPPNPLVLPTVALWATRLNKKSPHGQFIFPGSPPHRHKCRPLGLKSILLKSRILWGDGASVKLLHKEEYSRVVGKKSGRFWEKRYLRIFSDLRKNKCNISDGLAAFGWPPPPLSGQKSANCQKTCLEMIPYCALYSNVHNRW